MKFVHIADMHFDSPFVNLSDKGILGDLRRLEQRKILKKIIEYSKQNQIEYLFISGDLYDHKYVKRSTIEYINHLFEEIPKKLEKTGNIGLGDISKNEDFLKALKDFRDSL